MEHLEAHFINRYRTLINKGHLLFTEHQNFWNSIKNPSQKVKKCEIFSRFWLFLQNFQNFRIFQLKILLTFFKKNGNFEKFGKSSFFSENISHFFTFWDGFFMNFQKFWCSVKRRCPLLIRFLYLFMQCASKCSIIEIYRNGTKKVGLVDHFRATSPFPVSSWSLLLYQTFLWILMDLK